MFNVLRENKVLNLCVVLQETVAASMTDLERKNLRRAMYSREAGRTEEDEEGERSQNKTMTTVHKSLIGCMDDCSVCLTSA